MLLYSRQISGDAFKHRQNVYYILALVNTILPPSLMVRVRSVQLLLSELNHGALIVHSTSTNIVLPYTFRCDTVPDHTVGATPELYEAYSYSIDN